MSFLLYDKIKLKNFIAQNKTQLRRPENKKTI